MYVCVIQDLEYFQIPRLRKSSKRRSGMVNGQGKQSRECPGCLPATFAPKKGYFHDFMFFSVRILSGCFSSLLSSYWHRVLIFPLLLTLEEEKFVTLPRHVLPFLSPVRTVLSSPAQSIVKKRYGHVWRSMYLSNRTICPWGDWLLLLHLPSTDPSTGHQSSTWIPQGTTGTNNRTTRLFHRKQNAPFTQSLDILSDFELSANPQAR